MFHYKWILVVVGMGVPLVGHCATILTGRDLSVHAEAVFFVQAEGAVEVVEQGDWVQIIVRLPRMSRGRLIRLSRDMHVNVNNAT